MEVPPPLDLPRAPDFETFFRRELPGLVALARALAGPAYAEELAQESMLAAYQRWDQVGRYEFPSAWVRQVCANKAASVFRRRATEARALLRLTARAEPVHDDGDVDPDIWAEVRRLPRRQAQAIALYYVYGRSVTEVARILGCSEGSVKTHLHRGRATLAARLGTDGGDDT